MNLLVHRPGLLSTVQDRGRNGWQSRGIGPGGAVDPLALRLANILVGNAADAAGLEFTLTGPVLRFESDAVIAVTGANLSATIGDRPVPAWHAVLVRAGCELTFGAPVSGCRAYLAIAGGIDVPIVLGGRGTHLRARFGGLNGRALVAGDRLTVGDASSDAQRLAAHLAKSEQPWLAEHATLARELTATAYADAPVRLLPGRDTDRLDDAGRRAIFSTPFRVAPHSDRMGVRLEGPGLELAPAEPCLSEPVTSGTVQLPPDGQPIILLADRQTTGGYPVIGHVATVDLPKLAQRRPGESLRFAPFTLDDAQRAMLERERAIATVTVALHDVRARLDR